MSERTSGDAVIENEEEFEIEEEGGTDHFLETGEEQFLQTEEEKVLETGEEPFSETAEEHFLETGEEQFWEPEEEQFWETGEEQFWEMGEEQFWETEEGRFEMEELSQERDFPEERSFEMKSEIKSIELNEADLEELYRSHDPSYQNISVKLSYSLRCQRRLVERMKEVRRIFKYELSKILAEQTSAFDCVRIRRLYKTGIALPERIFCGQENGYTFQETERLRFLMNNEVL